MADMTNSNAQMNNDFSPSDNHENKGYTNNFERNSSAYIFKREMEGRVQYYAMSLEKADLLTKRFQEKWNLSREEGEKKLAEIAWKLQEEEYKRGDALEKKNFLTRSKNALILSEQEKELNKEIEMAIAKSEEERYKIRKAHDLEINQILKERVELADKELKLSSDTAKAAMKKQAFGLWKSDSPYQIASISDRILGVLNAWQKSREESQQIAQEKYDAAKKRKDNLTKRNEEIDNEVEEKKKQRNRNNDNIHSLENKIDKLKEKEKENLTKEDEAKLKQYTDDRAMLAENDTELGTEIDGLKAEQAGNMSEIASAEGEMAAAEGMGANSSIMGGFAGIMIQLLKDLINIVKSAFNKFREEMSNYIDEALSLFTEYMGNLNSRLYGSEYSFVDLYNNIKKGAFALNIFKMSDYIENLHTLVEKGVAFNLEQRTFWATFAEKISTTFDAMDDHLLRLIRIQQQDSTIVRLGLEASLNQFFNETFSDTSYLSDAFTSVAHTILDASTQLTSEQSAEFEYTVQKWLGSLYSVGLSSEAVNKIASGLNALATGDVTALAGSSDMQTLISKALADYGMDIADILINGLDASTTNELMKSIVEYLKTIASSTNQVVKSAYGGILGMSASDFAAFKQFTTEDIKKVYEQTKTAQSLYDYARSEALEVMAMAQANNNGRDYNERSRYTTTELKDNAYSNMFLAMASNIADNPTLASHHWWNKIVADYTGGAEVLGISLTDLYSNVETIFAAFKSWLNSDMDVDNARAYLRPIRDGSDSSRRKNGTFVLQNSRGSLDFAGRNTRGISESYSYNTRSKYSSSGIYSYGGNTSYDYMDTNITSSSITDAKYELVSGKTQSNLITDIYDEKIQFSVKPNDETLSTISSIGNTAKNILEHIQTKSINVTIAKGQSIGIDGAVNVKNLKDYSEQLTSIQNVVGKINPKAAATLAGTLDRLWNGDINVGVKNTIAQRALKVELSNPYSPSLYMT